MGQYQPLIWCLTGAAALMLANLAFCWFATAPDHYEWTDSLLFMTPVAAVLGGIVGGVAGTVRRRRLLRRQDGGSDVAER
jgi:hypothetical protein